MSRITNAELTNFFMHLCKDLGKKVWLNEHQFKAVKKWATEEWTPPCEVVPYGTVGAWILDYANCYGGWQIQEIETTGGGISCPLGHNRYKTNDFFAMICFARSALATRK